MSGNPVADEVWRTMASLVIDNRDSWKRAVMERTGLPFSRIRVLRRLARGPMTVKQVAAAATMDAPAATVAVNDLEDRGLVVRTPDPTHRLDRRSGTGCPGRAGRRRTEGIASPPGPSCAEIAFRVANSAI